MRPREGALEEVSVSADPLMNVRMGLKRLARSHPAAAADVDVLLAQLARVRADQHNARKRLRRADGAATTASWTPTGQGGQILALLRERGTQGATMQELLALSPNYTGRISDLRRAGYVILREGTSYVLGPEGRCPEPLIYRPLSIAS